MFKNKFFKNKFLIILICVAIVLVTFNGVFSVMGVDNFAKTVLGDIFSPVMTGIRKMGESLSGYSAYFSNMDELIKENERLKEQIKNLENQLDSTILTEEENDRLRDYLEIKESYEDFQMCEALIIGGKGDGYSSIIKINKGTRDGLSVNMPVIVKEGLVGVLCEVGSSWSNVRLICEASAGVGAYISRSGEIGILQGDIAYTKKGEMKLTYLDEEADVTEGDIVYTSGSGSVYPGGILVGTVTEVRDDEYSRSKVATVKCAVDFQSLQYVLVVKKFTGGEFTGDSNE